MICSVEEVDRVNKELIALVNNSELYNHLTDDQIITIVQASGLLLDFRNHIKNDT